VIVHVNDDVRRVRDGAVVQRAIGASAACRHLSVCCQAQGEQEQNRENGKVTGSFASAGPLPHEVQTFDMKNPLLHKFSFR
jgi:hypothetical protein